MRTPDATIRVLRALALLGASTAGTACNRTATTDTTTTPRAPDTGANSATASSSIAGSACGAQMPSEGTSCEGHTIGHECTWSDFLRCTCTQTPQGAQWKQCQSRLVPGPLPPPELRA